MCGGDGEEPKEGPKADEWQAGLKRSICESDSQGFTFLPRYVSIEDSACKQSWIKVSVYGQNSGGTKTSRSERSRHGSVMPHQSTEK